jgi:hypothetical protein
MIRLRASRSGLRIPSRTRYILFFKTSTLAVTPIQPTILSYRVSFQGEEAKGLLFTTYLHLTPRLKTGGAIPLLPPMPSWCGQGQLFVYLLTGLLGRGNLPIASPVPTNDNINTETCKHISMPPPPPPPQWNSRFRKIWVVTQGTLYPSTRFFPHLLDFCNYGYCGWKSERGDV